MENINHEKIKKSPEYEEFIKGLDVEVKESGRPSAFEIKEAKEALEAEEVAERLDREIKEGPVERRMGVKSDYYRRFYVKIYDLPQEKREAELDAIERGLDEEQLRLDAEEKKLAEEAIKSKKISKELKSRIRGYNQAAKEIKIKRSAYNALVKNFQNFKFSEDEKEVIEKPWKTHEVSEEMIVEVEGETPPELTPKKEKELLREAEKRETEKKIEQEMKKPRVELAPEYQAEIQTIEAEEKKEIAKLKEQIAQASKDKEIKEVISDFEPERFIKIRRSFFDLQRDLMDIYNFVPGEGFKNTLRVLFKKPKSFGEFLKLKKKYNQLNEYIGRQGDIVYSYLETVEKAVFPPKEKKEFGDFSAVDRLELEAAKIPDILARYKDDIYELDKQIKESKKNPEIAEVINFSAKEYFEDYVNMLSLQDELMENFGFAPGKSGTRNLWEAAKRGELKTYRYLKKTYDYFVNRLNKKEGFLMYLGADKLAKAKRDVKKIGSYKQPELWERLKRAMGE